MEIIERYNTIRERESQAREERAALLSPESLRRYVAYRVDDALHGEKATDFQPGDVLVGWQCGFEPLVVAVGSYLPGCTVDNDEAEELAADYLQEIKWFAGDVQEADFIVRTEEPSR